MNKKSSVTFLFFLAGLIAGCAAKTEEAPQISTAVAAERVQTEKESETVNLDFKHAIQTAVRNMLQSGALDNLAGERYTVSVSYIADTTKKGFNMEDIKKYLRSDLSSSRKVRVISAKNGLPQINVSGRIAQRTAYVRGGKKRQEYYLHLVLTEAKSGMKLWENTTPVVKKKIKNNIPSKS